MGADAQRLDERKLVQRELRRLVKLVDWHAQEFSHAAVGVHAEDLQVDATVGFAATSGDALATVQVRFDRAVIANGDFLRIRPHGDDLDTELVSEDARIGEERLPAPKRVHVGATDTDPMDADESFLGRWLAGMFRVHGDQLAGLFQDDRFHAVASSVITT
jgi:hypothetical protein